MSETETSPASENARRDYETLIDKVVLVSVVDGFTGDDGTTFVHVDPPAVMRVTPYASEHELASYVTGRWTADDRLDPIYSLTLLESHPQLDDMRSFWAYGQTYDDKGNAVEDLNLEIAPDEVQARHTPVANPTSPWRMG